MRYFAPLALAIVTMASIVLACPPSSTPSGDICVDKYEASVWEIPSTQAMLIRRVKNGRATLANLTAGGAIQHGTASDDYGASCPDTGKSCTNFYAASIPGVLPSRYLTYFQALAACRNAGKHLLTNAEWQAAALGTPDPAPDDGVSTCNVNVAGTFVNTGSRAQCVSDVGAFDMIANASEIVTDWGQIAASCVIWPAGYDNDVSCIGASGSTTLPGMITRGGSQGAGGGTAGVFAIYQLGDPTTSPVDVGFRCGQNR